MRTGLALVAVGVVCLGLGGQPDLPLTADQLTTLSSLRRVAPYPLYAMTYVGPCDSSLPEGSLGRGAATDAWACSLAAALGGSPRVYGRNFDWERCPVLVLFTRPPDGYASVSLVDVAFLYEDSPSSAWTLESTALAERIPLLAAPAIPFDGMNERGLVVGMAAVPSASPPFDPEKPSLHSVGLIREMLDHAATVEEALLLFDRFNVTMVGGPPIHYLIADRGGRAALVEFTAGRRVALRSDRPWHAATNFVIGPVVANPADRCGRYDRLTASLSAVGGVLTVPEMMGLLGDVSQASTQWSSVYDLDAGIMSVCLGRDYDAVFVFSVNGD